MLNITKILEDVKYKQIDTPPFEPYIIYEANDITAAILRENAIKPICICDDTALAAGKHFNGYTILSLEEALNKYEDINIYIASVNNYCEIRNHISKCVNKVKIIEHCSNHIKLNDSITDRYIDFFKSNEDRINTIYEMLSDERSRLILLNLIKGFASKKSHYFSEITSPDQYFPDVVKLSSNEVFIDGGAYMGDTIEKFKKKVNNEYTAIHSFEPTEKSFKILSKIKKMYFNNDPKIFIYKFGLSDKNDKAYFLTHNEQDTFSSAGNRVVLTQTNITIDVVRLDDLIKDEVTYIKLDVEGSELEALKGAKDIICKYKPKLAVCVYHNIEDIYNIPKYIYELGLPYKYYLRHHGREPNLQDETVFYAI